MAQRLRNYWYQSSPKQPVSAMNAKVEKKINGQSVTANPVYRGGTLPAYWVCAIDEFILPKTFTSAAEVFRFASRSVDR